MGNAKRRATNKRVIKSQPAPPGPSAASKSKWTSMRRWWGRYWGPSLGIVGLFSTVISIWTYFAPSIAITPGDNLDPSQEFQTQFVVTNRGNFPLYNMHFACSIEGSRVDIESLRGNGKTLRRIAKFPSGGVASRGCFVESRVRVDGRLKVDVYYTWSSFSIEMVQPAYFRVENGASGNMLVPDDDAGSSNSGALIKFAG